MTHEISSERKKYLFQKRKNKFLIILTQILILLAFIIVWEWLAEKKIIDDFMNSKADFIFRALDKYASIKALPQTQYFSENEVCDIILAICEKLYPHFMKSGIKRPIVKFRRMVSQWGSCHTKKGILTFNTNLMYAPTECIEYVAAHEFTHFLVPNHSDRFYSELSKIMPDWKARRQKLKKISIK